MIKDKHAFNYQIKLHISTKCTRNKLMGILNMLALQNYEFNENDVNHHNRLNVVFSEK